MADLHADRIQGNLVYWDGHRKRVIDAFGPDVIKVVEDFVAAPVDAVSGEYDPQWTITRVEAGVGESTFGPADAAGGVGRITTDANENDGINAQLRGEAFKLAAEVALYFGIRLKASEAAQSDFFVGLAITDTDILGGVTDRIGFEKLDGVTDVKAMLEKDSVETLSPALQVLDAAYHVYEFFLSADGNVEFFIDGVSVWSGMSVANLPNDEELRVTVQGLAGAAGAKTFDIDWVRCIQVGGRA